MGRPLSEPPRRCEASGNSFNAFASTAPCFTSRARRHLLRGLQGQCIPSVSKYLPPPASAHLQATQGRSRGVCGCEPAVPGFGGCPQHLGLPRREAQGPGPRRGCRALENCPSGLRGQTGACPEETKLTRASSASWGIWLGWWGCPAGEGRLRGKGGRMEGPPCQLSLGGP